MEKTIEIPLIPAKAWNALRDQARRNLPLTGTNVRLHWTKDGVAVSAEGADEFRHPWWLSPRWSPDAKIQPAGGQWVAAVRPGFVNCNDVTMEVLRANEKTGKLEPAHVDLTDDAPPEIVVDSFRDPAAPGGITASLSGEILAAAGEGYPKFFEHLGVVPPAKGGNVNKEGALGVNDPNRTRQIRAADIVLVTPRPAANQSVEALDPTTDGQSIEISTTIDTTIIASAPSPHWINVRSKFIPIASLSVFDKLAGGAVDAQVDELKLATIYFVSPPDAPAEAPVDQTWVPYPLYFVTWDLNHACRSLEIPSPDSEPLSLHSADTLGAGVAAGLISGLLSGANDAFEQIEAYLADNDMSGRYWSL